MHTGKRKSKSCTTSVTNRCMLRWRQIKRWSYRLGLRQWCWWCSNESFRYIKTVARTIPFLFMDFYFSFVSIFVFVRILVSWFSNFYLYR